MVCVMHGAGVRAGDQPDPPAFVAASRVLQRRCLSCHQDEYPKGDLSLQSAKFLERDDFIDRDAPEQSQLLSMVLPIDGKASMPKEGPTLSRDEIAALREWLILGAPWPTGVQLTLPKLADTDWWSLRPLQRPAVPQVPAKWQTNVANPIDAFIVAALQDKGLRPSSMANRATLARRLYFDLLGLPPTPAEVNRFVHNPHPAAYEQLVDELLASPRYGERWARHWLDVVHYGESHGYDKDKPRPNAWPYRDYVIRRLNADIPYERFVREQLAGDIFWPTDARAIEATGFIAAGPWDYIGHAEVPESKIEGQVARNLDRDDMVSNTMNTFVSTTVQCARCHDHKFDPVRQEHYYSLQSVFAALDRADRIYDVDPLVYGQRQTLNENIAATQQRIAQFEEQRIASLLTPELQSVLNELTIPDHPQQGYHSEVAKNPNTAKWVQVDLGTERELTGVILFPCHDTFAQIGPGFGFPLRFKIEACQDAEFKGEVIPIVDHTNSDFPLPGVTPVAFPCDRPVKARFVRVTTSHLATRLNDYIFALAEFAVLDTSLTNVALGAEASCLDAFDGGGERWRLANAFDGKAYCLNVSQDGIAKLWRLAVSRQQLERDFAHTDLGQQLTASKQQLADLQHELAELPAPSQTYVGTIHRGSGNFIGTGHGGGQPRPIHVLIRGEITQPAQEVGPGTIPILAAEDWRFSLPTAHHEGERRRALAQWIVRSDNPLTWRSIVNRLWQYHFGTAIVGSANDFGRMGELPTHPELLDWLACELQDHGQSWKHVHRMIVTSRTYQQSSADDPDCHAIDGSNQYCWRMNRRALDAESIRDSMLTAADTLNPEMYGPSFQDFTVEKPEHSPHYEYDLYDPFDHKIHRRAVYRFLVRSQPQPFMDTLDCADPSLSVPKRQTTITALQALSLMNNRFVLSMAELFSQRLERLSSEPREQIDQGFELAIGRPPSNAEREQILRYHHVHGLINTCRVLLNLNEFVFID